jgi:Tol biopolymer transport system component
LFIAALSLFLITGCRVATPRVHPPTRDFTESIDVSVSCSTDGATVRYTRDGTTPDSSSTIYTDPLNLNATTTVKARGFKSGWFDSASATKSATFTKYPGGATYRISINSLGEEGESYSMGPSLSADGRIIAFGSDADNLVSGDTNELRDVFVHDTTTGRTTRVSVSSSRQQGNDVSHWYNISADGRYVGFSSKSTNLVEGDTNELEDVFVHDRQTRQTVLVSLNSEGKQTTDCGGHNRLPSLSADGRFVAFESPSAELVPGDTNRKWDVFMHDRDTDQDGIFDELGTTSTVRVSVSSAESQGNCASSYACISADGRFVAFESCADNLVDGDTNKIDDVFVRDRQTSETRRISVSSNGEEGNAGSYAPNISADGRYVVFMSHADNLVPNDTNGFYDIFRHDLQTHTTELISVSSHNQQGNGRSGVPVISAQGRYVAFNSKASNLVNGDTNDHEDVFFRDVATGRTYRVSISSTGEQGVHYSRYPSLSANGRFVGFESWAVNMVPDDGNRAPDAYVRDRGQ